MEKKSFKWLWTGSLAFLFVIAGCGQQGSGSDNGIQLEGDEAEMAAEIISMGDELFENNTTAKVLGTGDSGRVSIMRNVEWVYDSDLKATIRTADRSLTVDDITFTSTRYDTVWIVGINGDTLEGRPDSIEQVATIYHNRRISRSGERADWDISLNTVRSISVSNDTVYSILNGSGSGTISIDGVPINEGASLTITDLMRRHVDGELSRPYSGSITRIRPNRTTVITFDETDDALITITITGEGIRDGEGGERRFRIPFRTRS